MPVYESESVIPASAGLQKPGAARYAFAADMARMLQERLAASAHGLTAKAAWTDVNRLALGVEGTERLGRDDLSQVEDAIRSLLGAEVQMSSLVMVADGEA